MAESAKALLSQQVTKSSARGKYYSDHVELDIEYYINILIKSDFCLSSLEGLHAIQRHLRLHAEEGHRVQPAACSERHGPSNQQVHPGNQH